MSSFYLRRNGKLYGPFSEDKLKILINNGTFGEEDQVTSDQISWQAVQDFRITMNIPPCDPYAQQGGYDQNYAQQGGYDQNYAQQDGYDPNYAQQGGYDPNYAQQGGYDPNYAQQGGYDPNAVPQGGYDPNAVPQGGYDPNYMQGGYAGKPSLWYCLFMQPRLSRQDFWLILLIDFLLVIAISVVLVIAKDKGSLTNDEFEGITGLVGLITSLLWIPLSLHRLHDSGKNGVPLIVYWAILIVSTVAELLKVQAEILALFGIALLVSGLYILILSILPGNPGPNKYGDVPARIF